MPRNHYSHSKNWFFFLFFCSLVSFFVHLNRVTIGAAKVYLPLSEGFQNMLYVSVRLISLIEGGLFCFGVSSISVRKRSVAAIWSSVCVFVCICVCLSFYDRDGVFLSHRPIKMVMFIWNGELHLIAWSFACHHSWLPASRSLFNLKTVARTKIYFQKNMTPNNRMNPHFLYRTSLMFTRGILVAKAMAATIATRSFCFTLKSVWMWRCDLISKPIKISVFLSALGNRIPSSCLFSTACQGVP